MMVFAHDGTCIFTGKWSTITAAKNFDSNLLNIPREATHWVNYNTGAVAALSVGEVLEGGTSGFFCTVVAQAVENGTAGAGDSGILFVKTVTGTFVAETLTGATSTGTVAIGQNFIALPKSSPHPKTVLLTVETAAVNCAVGETTAATTALLDYGVYMGSGTSRVVRGVGNVRTVSIINSVHENGAVVKYELYY
jgi:hypothetical protein